MNQNVIEANLLKLAYNELGPPCSDAAAAAWNEILEKGDEPVDMQILIEAVKAGMYANRSILLTEYAKSLCQKRFSPVEHAYTHKSQPIQPTKNA